jgi:hypothetical protein
MDYFAKSDRIRQAGANTAAGSLPARARIIDTGLEPETGGGKQFLKKKGLVNLLNLRHFQGGTIHIHFRHIHDNRQIAFEAAPRPCFGKYLVCLWKSPPGPYFRLSDYMFSGFSLTDGNGLIQAKSRVRGISASGICLYLPEKSAVHAGRKELRHPCPSVSARIIQNSLTFSGTLKNLSTSAFCVAIEGTPEAPEAWLNNAHDLTLVLESNGAMVYSGQCRILKAFQREHESCLVLAALKDTIQRFPPRVYRSRRLLVSPAPDVVFRHPLTGTMVDLKAADISGAGICVTDEKNANALIAGMLIEEMTLCFANAFQVKCRAQVIYRKLLTSAQKENQVQCGIAFLDMAPNDHMRLLSLLHQSQNDHLYICHQVDMDELWAFFFETGFIYPRKYSFIQNSRQSIRETYKKLYTCQPEIARHFTWQKNGKIIAHVAMLRFYENTWLIHHLASRTDKRVGLGTEIIDQLGAFTYDTHRLASAHMAYAICYYRPSNRFPAHFFGGVAGKIGNPRACSTDRFAYYHWHPDLKARGLPRGWSLESVEYEDLKELEAAYRQDSDGLMLKALDLMPEKTSNPRSTLSDLYAHQGLKRQRRVFALRQQGRATALLMANVSDFAVNLSDLTNSVSIFVIDRSLSYAILQQALCMAAEVYETGKVPVLLYPLSYAQHAKPAHHRIHHRIYELWVLNLAHTDDFFKHYQRLK